jgi:hypothetical protein
MNAPLEFVSGRCTNELFCAVASAGDIVRVPAGARFVCSYCGGKLEEASAPSRRIGLRGGAIIGGSMAVTGIALFAVGFWIGTPPAPAAPVAAQAPQRQVESAIAAPVAIADAARATPEQADAPTQALQRPAMTLATKPDSWAGAPRPVTVELAIAEQPIPKAVADIARLKAPRNRAQAVAMATERTQNVTAIAPDVQPATPTDADQLNAKEAANFAKAVPAAAPDAAPEARRAAGPTRGFVPQPVSGGAPIYPAAYDGGDRKGAVTVSCRIEVTGAPTGCHVLHAVGGQAFAAEINTWLDSGRVRFAPIVHNGQAVAETHEWTVQFQPQSGS